MSDRIVPQRRGEHVVDLAGRLVATVRRVLGRRRARRALARLDDRTLSDIGIGPGEVDHAIRHGRADEAAGRRVSR